jgi:putative hemolysin
VSPRAAPGGQGQHRRTLGIVLKRDLLHQVLDGRALDPLAVIRESLVVHEAMTIFKVLEQFKKAPVRLAMIVDEYGGLQGIVTQTDLLEAIAGNLPDVVGEEPEAVEREDGSLLIDGMMSAQDAFDRLAIPAAEGGFHTIAGFVLSQLGHLPVLGEHFDYEGWRFEVVDLDGRRIDKLLVVPPRA